MFDFFAKLLDKQTLVFLILGAVFTLVFVFQGIPIANVPIKGSSAPWISFGLGILFLALGIFSFFDFFAHKESSAHLKKKYGIVITSPNVGDLLLTPVELKGKYKARPEKDRVYVIERNDQTHHFRIKNEVVFYEGNTWRCQISLGNGDDLPRTLIVAFLGDESKIFYDYYFRVRNEKNGSVSTRGLPSDFHRLAEVTIKLKKI